MRVAILGYSWQLAHYYSPNWRWRPRSEMKMVEGALSLDGGRRGAHEHNWGAYCPCAMPNTAPLFLSSSLSLPLTYPRSLIFSKILLSGMLRGCTREVLRGSTMWEPKKIYTQKSVVSRSPCCKRGKNYPRAAGWEPGWRRRCALFREGMDGGEIWQKSNSLGR